MANPYSRLTLALVGGLVVLGLLAGLLAWQDAPATYPPNEPANNAIAVHWVLAAVAGVATVTVAFVARRRDRPQPFSLPFRQRALRRVVATLRMRPWSLLAPVRALVTLLLLYVLLWEPFRAAMQVFAALAPSWTANAWGGPGYWGASLAHWLDGYLLFFAAAALLNLVLARPVGPAA
ncbi:hypothetical protein [Angustibacter luteus]|uniref:Cytochrome b561 bacterial/Ni-hydrogenase domain-containing protein n=1 Tax=Angustibacter luteus TaxID=658456 RepID=A0ABW1JJE4_9ACTN